MTNETKTTARPVAELCAAALAMEAERNHLLERLELLEAEVREIAQRKSAPPQDHGTLTVTSKPGPIPFLTRGPGPLPRSSRW